MTDTRRLVPLVSVLFATALAVRAPAQPNVIPGTDIALCSLGSVASNGHTGAYPSGVVAVGMSTTASNPGSVPIPWYVQPNPNKPFIAFLVARDYQGRFTQISNRSYCKHPFASTNSPGCGSCIYPGTSQLLGVGCADTYGASLNGLYTYLGPPDEINPWLGTWAMYCSYFDYGYPPQPTCDGQLSPVNYPTSTGPPRCLVNDADFAVLGAAFYAQAGWITKGELESLRGNNFASRPFTATWSGANWTFTATGTQIAGSVLQRWTGASLASNTNGADDGRVFVAVKVTGPTNGLYHYEYAVHNRDNQRGIGAFRIPICPEGRVMNVGFKDIDANAANNWAFFQTPNEIAWSTAGNALKWNSIFNCWFDSDAAPVTGSAMTLDEALPGPGQASVTVTTTAPLGSFNVFLGAGCGTPTVPTLYATGTPPRAALPNGTFGLATGGNAAGAGTFLLGSALDGSYPVVPGCTAYLGGLILFGAAPANALGVASYPIPVPNDGTLEGIHVNFHAIEAQPGTGAIFGAFDLSDGLRVRLGNFITNCP